MKIKELIRGQIYEVTESCGMMILRGEYLGKLNKGAYNFQCFVFKTIEPRRTSSYKYFGANWRMSEPASEKPSFYLYNTHYGHSAKSLKPLGELYAQYNEEKLDFEDNE